MSESLFYGHGVQFAEVITSDQLGGRAAVDEYVQHRSNQVLRSLRKTKRGADEYDRYNLFLSALAEVTRTLKAIDKKVDSPS